VQKLEDKGHKVNLNDSKGFDGFNYLNDAQGASPKETRQGAERSSASAKEMLDEQ